MASQPIVIAVMGPSGSGKTNFINKLTETREGEVLQLSSYSQGIEEYTVNPTKDRQYVFVDTPGFDDTYQPDGVILYTIADWLEKKYRTNVNLSGIIYTHRITDDQMSGSACKNLDMFAQLCRDRAAGGVRLVTTMWNEVQNREHAESRVSQLEQNFWRPLIDAGARHRRFEENSSRCAWEIVEDLTGGALLPQEEAKAQRDPELVKQLEAEQRSLQAEPTKTSDDMDKQKISFSKRIALFFSKKTHPNSAITLQFEDGHPVAENDYVIFVIGPTEAEKTWFTSQLYENHDEGRHLHTENVKAWRCSLGSGSDNIIVVDTPSFHSDRNHFDAENRMKGWLESKFTKNCHFAILFLHSLDSDPTSGNMPMSWHLETFAKTFRNKLTVSSDIYVVPTSNPVSILPSQTLSRRLSQLKTMTERLNGKGKHDWHASIFPGVFEGKPETAWNAALLLLKGIAHTQTKEFLVSSRPATKCMPSKSPDSCLALKDIADILFKEFKQKERNRDLDAIIMLGKTALEFTPLGHPHRHSALIDLAVLLQERFNKEGRKEDLDELITLNRAASESISPDEPQRQTILLELDNHLFERFKRTDSTVDLEEIISLRRAALERIPPPNRCRALLNLANALHEQSQKPGTENSISEAVSLARTAKRLCPPGNSDCVLSQEHLASHLETTRLALKYLAKLPVKEFEKKERDCDLDAMITLRQTVLEFIPPQHPQRLSVLIGLAGLLSERFNKEGRKEDLDELITLKRAASEYMSPDEPQRQTILRRFNNHLFECLKRMDSAVDLEENISLRRAALECTPQPNRYSALLNLADALHEQFQKQGKENSLAEAVSLARAASGLCPPGHPDYALSRCHLESYLATTRLALKNLAKPPSKEFEKKERNRDLDAMVTLGQTALEFTPPQHPQHLSVLIDLAALVLERFNQEGRKEDLDELITLKRAASEYMSPDEPQRQTILLELDDHLFEHFKRTDSTVDLEEIISLRRAGLERIPPPNRCRALLKLADALHEQYQEGGTENSLAEAVSLAGAASGLCPPEHPDYALFRCQLESYLTATQLALNDLANPRSKESKKKERDRDLDAMINLGQTALEFTPLQHPQRLSVLIGLAGILSERSNKEGRKEDLDELITLKRAALEYMPPDEPQRQTILLELDDHLFERFKRTDSTVDLEEIISLRRDALERIPQPNRCRALLKLADALHEQYQEQGMENSLAEAVSLAGAASSLRPPGHADHALSRDHLARYLETTRLALNDLANPRSKESRKKERDRDLDAMINLGQTALEFTPLQHPQRLSVLIGLAGLLSERFNKEGRKEDLDKLITLKSAASESVSPDEPQRQTILLELDGYLSEHFKRTDSMVDLEEFISLRRAALGHISPPNRCRALLNLADALHEQYKKKGTEESIDEAASLAQISLDLNPSGHPDHVLCRDHLAGYLETKIGKKASCSGVRAPGAGPSSVSSSDTKQSIKKVVTDKVEKIPLRLLHTPTGVLCDRNTQISRFENSPQYERLLSLPSSLDRQQLETEINNVISEYFEFAMLSHRWGSGEPLLRDVQGKSVYNLSGTDGAAKLQKFCILAFRRNFQWAWSDTCCIDKDSSAELQEAIGSMFSWYRWSSLTIVHLSGVSDTCSLAGSDWFTRGWTLQELLASRTVLFYTYDWSLYSKSDVEDHKSDPTLLKELQDATGIAIQHLTKFSPGMDDARSRLHWASRRRTTRPEDIAYSLFGIFQVHLSIFYGESTQNALGRLLAEIISRSGDVSVLDWVGKPSSFNSCFPTDLAPYQMVPHFPLIPSDPVGLSNLDFEKAQKLYRRLAGLPRAGFFNSKLTLPSTVHPVMAVKLQGSSTGPLRPTYEIRASRLRPLNVALSVELDESVDTYILVRPWHPKSVEQQTGSVDAVWKLLEQLEQPFNALLLKRSLHNEYTRIACDCTITARIQDITSILDSEVLIPEIV